MVWQLTPYLVPFALGGLFCVGLGLYGYVDGRSKGFDKERYAYLVLMAGGAIWNFARAFEVSVATYELKFHWLTVSAVYVGYGITPTAVALFVVSYAGYGRWITYRRVLLLTIVPSAALGLAATNHIHHALWIGDVVEVNGNVYRSRETSALFDFIAAYAILISLLPTLLLVRKVRQTNVFHRIQIMLVMGGVLSPIVLGILYVMGYTAPFGFNDDFTATGHVATGVLFALATIKYDFLDLSPIARDSVIEEMDDPYIVLDENDCILDRNTAAQELLGIDSSVAGMPIQEIAPACVPLLEEGGAMEITVETDDETRYFEGQVSSLRETASGMTVLLLNDVTEQEHIRKRYQAYIENTSDILTVVDSEGVIDYVSPSIERHLGIDADSLLGENFLDTVHPGDVASVRDTFEACRSEESDTARFEYRTRHTDSDWQIVEVIARNALDDQLVQGIILSIRDVTERKRRERELERTNDRLEQFASVVSHDLRNPLSVANGHLELAKDGDNGDHLEQIESSHHRMESIIDDVLAMARYGQTVEDPVSLEIADIAETAWENVDTHAGTLDVRVSRTIDGDRDSLLRAFENLFRNAFDHGPPDATVTVGDLDTGFYVADDGPGIPDDEREDVLEWGYTTTEAGSGLGLAIVSDIADAHGYSLVVTESDAGGAQFEFHHDDLARTRDDASTGPSTREANAFHG